MDHIVIAAVGLFLAGLLAGEELVVRYGVRAAIDVLEPRPHIELRQALIRRLRVLVPAIFGPTLLVGIVLTVLERGAAGSLARVLGVVALLVWLAVTLGGTVPINEAAVEWDAAAPPRDWRALVTRWERLNTVRCWASLLAFACFLAGAGLVVSAVS